MTMTDPNAFLMGGGAASAKFPVIGTTVTGTIIREPEVMQQSDFTTGELKFWNDGRPMQQLQVVLSTSERDPADPNDDGERALYVKANMQKAVRDAIRAAGAPGIAVGGVLSVTYIGDGEITKRGMSAPKLFNAAYTPPTTAAANGFLTEQQPAAQAPRQQYAPPAPAADQWNQPIAQAPAFAQPAPAAPVQQPTPEQQLAAGQYPTQFGAPPAQAQPQYQQPGINTPNITPAPPAPPAQALAGVSPEAIAALSQLSPEQRAALGL